MTQMTQVTQKSAPRTDTGSRTPRLGDTRMSITIAAPAERVLYRPEEAAMALGIGRSLVYEEIRLGRLRTVRIGRRRLIRLSTSRSTSNC